MNATERRAGSALHCYDRIMPTPIPMQTCPRCGTPMPQISGSKSAVCRRCGYKDDCC